MTLAETVFAITVAKGNILRARTRISAAAPRMARSLGAFFMCLPYIAITPFAAPYGRFQGVV